MSCIPINDFSLISLCDATKAGKLYSIVPDTGAGDFDVTRASTATYLGADGLLKTAANNEPRIEFNPDGSYKGLLVEPAATNLLLRSEEFDDAYWTKFQSTATANTSVAPDGTTTADTITSVAGATFPSTRIAITAAENTVFTLTSFVKAGTATNWRLTVVFKDGVNAATAVFNSLNGAVTDTLNVLSTSFIPYPNGWFRCSITFNSGAGANDLNVRPVNHSRSSIGGNEFTDGRTVFLWGAQLELGTVPTSYIPTVASTVTRAADVISKTGASALIGQTEGTLYAEVDLSHIGTARTFISLSSNSASNRTEVLILGTGVVRAFINGALTRSIDSSAISIGKHKIAVVYSASDFKLFLNGALIGTVAGTTLLSNYTKIVLGGRFDNRDQDQLNDHIKTATLLPTAISEQAAINLTS